MPNVLFLDDDPTRCKTALSTMPYAVIVTTAQAAIAELSKDLNKQWDAIFLDHDLGGHWMVDSDREDCGMAVVKWLTKWRVRITMCFVHTYNAPAGNLMDDELRLLGYKSFRAMYSPDMLKNAAVHIETKINK